MKMNYEKTAGEILSEISIECIETTREGWTRPAYHWDVTIRRGAEQGTVKHTLGYLNPDAKYGPQLEHVMQCLIVDSDLIDDYPNKDDYIKMAGELAEYQNGEVSHELFHRMFTESERKTLREWIYGDD